MRRGPADTSRILIPPKSHNESRPCTNHPHLDEQRLKLMLEGAILFPTKDLWVAEGGRLNAKVWVRKDRLPEDSEMIQHEYPVGRDWQIRPVIR
jgi:hypothetical protein